MNPAAQMSPTVEMGERVWQVQKEKRAENPEEEGLYKTRGHREPRAPAQARSSPTARCRGCFSRSGTAPGCPLLLSLCLVCSLKDSQSPDEVVHRRTWEPELHHGWRSSMGRGSAAKLGRQPGSPEGQLPVACYRRWAALSSRGLPDRRGSRGPRRPEPGLASPRRATRRSPLARPALPRRAA